MERGRRGLLVERSRYSQRPLPRRSSASAAHGERFRASHLAWILAIPTSVTKLGRSSWMVIWPGPLSLGPRRTWVFASALAALIVAIFAADAMAGSQAGLGSLVLAPVLAAVWFLPGRWSGVLVLVAALLWLGSGLIAGVSPVTVIADLLSLSILSALGRVIANAESARQAGEARLAAASHSQRLRRFGEARLRFTNSAADRLRAPLTVIHGYLSMMADGSLPHDRWRSAAEVGFSKAAEMNRLINETIEEFRMTEGIGDIEREVVERGGGPHVGSIDELFQN